MAPFSILMMPIGDFVLHIHHPQGGAALTRTQERGANGVIHDLLRQ